MFEGGGGGWTAKKGRRIGVLVSVSIFSIFQRLKFALATQTVEHLDKRTLIVYKRVFRDTQILVTNINHS